MRLIVCISILLFCLCFKGNSQDDKYEASSRQSTAIESFHTLLDSASAYKSSDIQKSIDFVAKALERLPAQGQEKERALSLSTLGDIYQYHQQFDLAIDSYRDAQELYKTTRTALQLGEVLIQTRALAEAQEILSPLIEIEGMIPYQRLLLMEYLGDVYAGLEKASEAVAFYEQGLKIAKKNRISPKIPDLNSKIADVYANDNRLQEAEAYYNSSLAQAAGQAPKRAVREKEKVADFYNRENRYDDEIKLRKKSLSELKSIPAPDVDAKKESVEEDSITAQQINYKIANAYLAQDKYEEAISYLVESINQADDEDDLEVKKNATRTLSELYREKGDFNKALETYQKYVAVVDTLYVRKEREIALAARFSREIAAKQNRINSLESDRQLSESKFALAVTQQQLIQETNRKQKWVIYTLILLILLTTVTAFFFYRSNKQQKLTNNLLALKSLRKQMNPHFIFNALNSVNSYIAQSDERSANKYLSDFSTLMRAVLENSEQDFIPLAGELDLIKLYLKLEQSRFPEKFDYKVNIGPKSDLKDYLIPPMLLQPFVENAVWHGLRYKEDKGLLQITVRQKNNDSLEVIIEDDGIGRKKSEELKTKRQSDQKSTGMTNIKKRIEILNSMYKDKIDLNIADLKKDGSGTRVIVTLTKNK